MNLTCISIFYTTGALGDLYYSHIHYSQRECIPSTHFKSWAESTNIFQYLGVHYVDSCFGLQVLFQFLSNLFLYGRLQRQGINTSDSILVILSAKPILITFTYAFYFLIDSNQNLAMSTQELYHWLARYDQLWSNQSWYNSFFCWQTIPTSILTFHQIPNWDRSLLRYGITSVVKFLKASILSYDWI